jgi:hypothetical protein
MYKSLLQLEFVDWQWSSDHYFILFYFFVGCKVTFQLKKERKHFLLFSVAASTFSWRGNTEVL